MVDAADIPDYFVDIVRIEIIAEEDGEISNLKVKICREGKYKLGNNDFHDVNKAISLGL